MNKADGILSSLSVHFNVAQVTTKWERHCNPIFSLQRRAHAFWCGPSIQRMVEHSMNVGSSKFVREKNFVRVLAEPM